MPDSQSPLPDCRGPMPSCRVLPYSEADGPANMALDEALLDTVAETPKAAVLRTYGWSVPTLSLGYFQKVAEVESDPRLRGVPIVRRPTGGGAIWHHHELTYALVVPRVHPLAKGPTDLYRAVHSAIAEVVRAQGASAERRGPTSEQNRSGRPFFCFTNHDSEDIVLHGVKIVGSAQRRRAGAVLQHGSVLLARSELVPEWPGLGDVAKVPTSPQFWANRASQAIARTLELELCEDVYTHRERCKASDLERTVYRKADWVQRR